MTDTPTTALEHAALDLSTGKATARVLLDVAAERTRAEELFPDQHLPDGTPENAHRIGAAKALELAEHTRDMFRKVCQDKAAHGTVTWWDVVREEFYEAGAETNPQNLRDELVQLAAMVVRWIEDIDLRAVNAELLIDRVLHPETDLPHPLDTRERKVAERRAAQGRNAPEPQ